MVSKRYNGRNNYWIGKKKERKIAAYKASGIEKQWLLIVIGSAGESSYEVEGKIEIELKTDFDKVFILEDFKSKLYELK